MNSGGSWQSQSITTDQVPRARSRPAVIARDWPKLRARRMPTTCSSSSASLSTPSQEPLGQRSSTRMIS